MSCLLLAGTQALAQQPAANSVLGAWQRQSESDGQLYVMTFQPNGTGTLQSGSEVSYFKWHITDDILTMDGGGSVFVVQIAVAADTLTMTDNNTQVPAIWHRTHEMPQAVQKESPPATPQTQYPESNSSANQPKTNEKNIKGLIGYWKNAEGNIMQFKNDGTAIIGGSQYKYTVSGDIITLTGYDGSMQMPYKLNGHVLNLTLNEQAITLNRSLP